MPRLIWRKTKIAVEFENETKNGLFQKKSKLSNHLAREEEKYKTLQKRKDLYLQIQHRF